MNLTAGFSPLKLSLVPLSCQVLIFCILSPSFPFHIRCHRWGSERTSSSSAGTLIMLSDQVTLLVHQNPSPLHHLDHIIQCLNILYHLLPACETLGSLHRLLNKVQTSHRGALTGTQAGALCLPLAPVQFLYLNRHSNIPGLMCLPLSICHSSKPSALHTLPVTFSGWFQHMTSRDRQHREKSGQEGFAAVDCLPV